MKLYLVCVRSILIEKEAMDKQTPPYVFLVSPQPSVYLVDPPCLPPRPVCNPYLSRNNWGFRL